MNAIHALKCSLAERGTDDARGRRKQLARAEGAEHARGGTVSARGPEVPVAA
jgi:hypothetical protein